MNTRIINASILKWIAVITMLIDHIGLVFLPEYEILRWIGRISFPIFAFLLCEGYKHTSNIWKYFLRLGIFAIISEIPYNICLYNQVFYPYSQNIFFELLLGLLVLYLIDKEYVIKGKNFTIYCQILIVVLACVVSYFANFSYKYVGILLIVIMYYIQEHFLVFSLAAFVVYLIPYGLVNAVFILLSLPLIYMYNGKLGISSKKLKWMFYAIYPLQFVVFIIIRDYIL